MPGINIFSPTSSKRLSLVALTILLLSGWCFGQAAIKLSATSGWPTYSLKVSGSNFSASTAVNIYFDTTLLTSATSDSSGSFSSVPIKIPASALPGTHYITVTATSTNTRAKAGFMVQTNWPQVVFDANHTGFNPYENVISPANVGNLKPRWDYVGGGTPAYSSPVVVNGIVYSAVNKSSGGGAISAVDANTGALRWRYDATTCGQPSVSWGAVYVPSCFGIYALNAKTGTVLWRYPVGAGQASSPTQWNNTVYVGSADGKLLALNASNGALLWSYYMGGVTGTAPAVTSSTVYVASASGVLHALTPRTGALLWSYNTDLSPGGPVHTPLALNGVVYFASYGKLYALNACTGAFLWSYVGAGDLGSLAIANGVLYAISSAKVYALHATSGAVMWTYGVPAGGLIGGPTIANGVAYVTGYPGTIALNASTGALLWSYSGSGSTGSYAVVVNGLVYFVDGQGVLRAFGL